MQMQDVEQQDPAHAVIGHNSDQVVDRCNQRTGSDSGVHLDFLEKQRNQCADGAGNQHGEHQRGTDAARYGKREHCSFMLEQHDIKVEWVTNGSDIYEYAMYTEYDILILDWMMPGENGVDACARLRKDGYQKAILMLTARDSVEDRVTGLDAGADDYLVKPFEFEELLARLRALGRRSTQKIQQDVVQVGEFSLNRTAKVLKKKDQVIQLSPREFQIFDLLAQNIGIVVPRDIILDRIWGLESDVSSNNIDSYMKILRKKLDEGDGAQSVIKTVRGVGYKLEANS